MQARGYPPESNAHGSGDEGKTQNDQRMLRREHVILARTSSEGEQVPDQFRGGEENRVSSGFTAREIPCVHEQLHHLSGEHAESTICPVCGVTRYKKRKKAPQKVVWYFPITPHLQQYFADPKQAKLLHWHADREEKKREDDGNDPEINKKGKMLSHPKDASQWQALNFEHREFGD